MGQSNKLWQTRFKRAVTISHWLKFTPFIRMVGLNGSMMTNRMNKNSDIDFYIVTDANRLYITRTIATIIVHLSGWRRYGQKIRGRVCLNRFATVDALQITPNNNYHARVFSCLLPLVSINNTYEKYLQQNRWMNKTKYKLKHFQNKRTTKGLTTILRGFGELMMAGFLGDKLESILKNWQTKKIMSDSNAFIPGSRVKIKSNELCFHNKKNHV